MSVLRWHVPPWLSSGILSRTLDLKARNLRPKSKKTYIFAEICKRLPMAAGKMQSRELYVGFKSVCVVRNKYATGETEIALSKYSSAQTIFLFRSLNLTVRQMPACS